LNLQISSTWLPCQCSTWLRTGGGIPKSLRLSDKSSTSLRLPGICTVSDFRNSYVTCLEAQAWRVPDGDESRNLSSRRDNRQSRSTGPDTSLPQSRRPLWSLYLHSYDHRGHRVFLGYPPFLTDVCAELRGPGGAPSSQQRKRSTGSAELDPSRNKHARHLTLVPYSSASLVETPPPAGAEPSASRNGDVQPSTRHTSDPNAPNAALVVLSPDVGASSAPPGSRRLTKEHGHLWVYSKNQARDDGTLSAWTVRADVWGGRLGDRASSPRSENPKPTTVSTKSSVQPEYDSH
jgi:hypothetical protein